MNILTFNAEDWYNGDIPAEDKDWTRLEYRVDKIMTPILDELDRRGVKATIFCMGWLADNHPEMVREFAKRGHQIGCNGYWHDDPLTMSVVAFREEIARAKEVLERVSGAKVDAYRAPNFSIDEERLDVIKSLGFVYDSSTIGLKPMILGNGLKEYPVANYKGKIPFSGGGFFRLMPYCLIKRFMKGSEYVMTYFHPRDFDKDMPLWPGLSAKEKFLTTVGVASAYEKWLKMIDEFEFVNIEQAKL